MASFSCNEPAAINPGDTVDLEIKQGDYRYFKPLCEVLTKSLIVDVQDVTGSSSVFISSTEKNPGAFNCEWQDSSDANSKVITVNRQSATGGPQKLL